MSFIDGSVQERRNSSALMGVRLSYINPSVADDLATQENKASAANILT